MASRGWQGVTEADLASKLVRRVNRDTPPRQAPEGTTLAQGKSKYRNVKTVADGIRFDSRREADYWMGLRARERAGEITELARQTRFPLYAPIRMEGGDSGMDAQICEYVADFTYREAGFLRVVDAKGMRTQVYRLKAKWLNLQEGLDILEV